MTPEQRRRRGSSDRSHAREHPQRHRLRRRKYGNATVEREEKPARAKNRATSGRLSTQVRSGAVTRADDGAQLTSDSYTYSACVATTWSVDRPDQCADPR